QGGIPACHHRHLELVLRAEQGTGAERPPVGVGHDRTGLLEDERRAREVVGRVVEHRSAAHALELLAHAGHVLHQPGPGSTYASSCPVTTRVMSNAAEPSSNVAPP